MFSTITQWKSQATPFQFDTNGGTRKDEELQEKTRRDDIMRQARLDRLSLCLSVSLFLPFARSL